MLQQNLTLDKALAELDQPQQFLTWELTPEDPFVTTYKEAQALVTGIFSEKLAVDRGLVLIGDDQLRFADTDEAQEAKKRHEELGRRLSTIFDEHFNLLKAKLITALGLGKRSAPHHDHFVGMLFEMLINAIEHGSNFCEAGKVITDVRVATDGVVCSIIQPKPGPDAVLLDHLISIGNDVAAYHSFLKGRCKQGRGNGFLDALWNFKPLFWFETHDDQGVRTVMLETQRRVKQIEKAMRERAEKINKKFGCL